MTPASRYAAVCLAGAALLCASCSNGNTGMVQSSTADPKPQGDGKLTAGEAKAALVVLIKSSPEEGPIRGTLEAVRTATPRETAEGLVAIGPWQCNLRKRIFVFTIINHPVYFFEVKGDFVEQPGGGWVAVITYRQET